MVINRLRTFNLIARFLLDAKVFCMQFFSVGSPWWWNWGWQKPQNEIPRGVWRHAVPWNFLSLESLKAWFHDSEILREKLFMRNTDGWAWIILLNSLTFFAFAVSRTEFYSLAKRIFCSRRENSMELFMCNHPYFA